MTNIFGPGHYANTGETTTRPNPAATGKPLDTWFQQCLPNDPNSGTNIDEMWLNLVVAQLRQATRTSGASESELSDDMIAEAACRAASGGIYGVDSGSAGACVVTTPLGFVTPKSLFAGMRARFLPAAANPGAATLNAFGMGTKSVLKPDGVASAGGEFSAGLMTSVWYDPAANAGAGGWRIDPWALPSVSGGSGGAALPGFQFGQELLKQASTTLRVSAGTVAADSADANIVLAAPLDKNVSNAWMAGNGNGGLDTGSLSTNSWYHVFSIRKDDGTADGLVSLSATAPAIPTGYTKRRLRGSIYVDVSGVIRGFIQFGDRFQWETPTLDIDASNPPQTAVLRTLMVPPTRRVTAFANAYFVAESSTDKKMGLYVSEPGASDTAFGGAIGAPLATIGFFDSPTPDGMFGWFECLTNTSAQVRTRLTQLEPGTNFTALKISTIGWIDRRNG